MNQLDAPPIIKEAMQYSLEAGGKRIRPLLIFATLDALELNLTRVARLLLQLK